MYFEIMFLSKNDGLFCFQKKDKKSGFICNREPFVHHLQKSSDSTEVFK